MKNTHQDNKWDIKELETFEDTKSIKNYGEWYLCKDEEFWNMIKASFDVYFAIYHTTRDQYISLLSSVMGMILQFLNSMIDKYR